MTREQIDRIARMHHFYRMEAGIVSIYLGITGEFYILGLKEARCDENEVFTYGDSRY